MNTKRPRAPPPPSITRNTPLATVHTLAAATGNIKNTAEAKSHLFERAWCLPGEVVALDVLARTLFALVVDEKLSTVQSNAIASIAFLLTERLEEKIIQGFTDRITELARSMVETLTADLHSRLE